MRGSLMAITCVVFIGLASSGRAHGDPGSGSAGAANPFSSLLDIHLRCVYDENLAPGQAGGPSGGRPDEEPDAWKFRFTPYFWAADLDGTVGVDGVDSCVDASFSDIWDDLQIALLGHLEAEKGDWLLFFDGMYMNLEADGKGPAKIVRAEVDMYMYIIELGGGYRAWETHYGDTRSDGARDHARLDVLGGARYMRMETDLDLKIGGATVASGDDTEWWVDPFVGARIRWSPLSRFEAILRGDIGGFGFESDFVWNVTGGVSLELMENLAVLAGYRIFDVDYSDGGFKFDARMKGPWAGVMLVF